MSTPRFLIGIDLGTTNSAVAYVDLEPATPAGTAAPRRRAPSSRVELFHVPQQVAPGEVAPRETLPSFVYFPDADASSRLVGVFARDQGALQPTRQVSSAKSWLCHPAVDRTARILPWGADTPVMSPVEASTAVLCHLRDAWNAVFAAHGRDTSRMERQDIVLTVPASFDQEARELTLQAARDAGFERLTLLEEPLAAFYAWISSHRRALERTPRARAAAADAATEDAAGCDAGAVRPFADGEQVLVCDVGGGTSDFTLIRVRIEDDEISFERTAVGEHLLLGGDNLDLALARHLEHKLGDRSLTLVQRLALRRSASAAKERLLAEPSCERVPVAVLGSGRSVVGGALSTELTRQEVVDALTGGFLPLVGADERPARDRRTALRELGLPYAEDAAITRHLAAFLEGAAAQAAWGDAASAEEASARGMLRPDAVLFNGGFFTPAIARERILQNLDRWFPGAGQAPRVLENASPAAAVALGAAYFALVRRRGGLRVRAGSSRGYYIGVGGPGDHAVCILPRGTEEGTSFDLGEREFAVMTNRPVSFPLYSSVVRHDAAGTLVALDAGEMHAHAPLATVLRYGKKSRQVDLAVSLSATYTETGTLQVACAARGSDHRWRLQFQLRGEQDLQPEESEQDAESLVPADRVTAARDAIEAVFGTPRAQTPSGSPLAAPTLTPEALPAHLETTLGFGRQAWPLVVIRQLADALLAAADGRRRGPRFEARWLNLLGFCLRPGFGAPLDDWRVEQARRIYVEGLVFASDLQCQAEWMVLWQRVAGGLKAGQQRELYQRHATLLDVRGGRKPRRLHPQLQREGWRLLASLEQLSAGERAKLGEVLLDRLEKDPGNASLLWAIGRLGARMPAHGPVTAVIPPDRAEAWMERLLSLRTTTAATATALVEIGAPSSDPLRDVGAAARDRAAERLAAAGFPQEAAALREFRPPTARDALQLFGETLPVGLRLKADS